MGDEYKKIKSFTDLLAWQKAHALVLNVYRLTDSFPDKEKFGLTAQVRRCSVSVVSNIAEGFGRNTAKDKAQFYAVAKGSLLELQAQLLIAKDLKYIRGDVYGKIESDILEVVRLIAGLVKSAKDR